MVTQDLLNYIKGQFDAGVERVAVEQALVTKGWSEVDVKQAIEQVLNPKADLQDINELFKISYQTFLRRKFVYLGIYFIPYLVITIFVALGILLWVTGVFNSQTVQGNAWYAAVPIGIVVLTGLIYLSVWSYGALIVSIRDEALNIGIGESYSKARPYIFSYIAVAILIGLFVMSAAMLFIIPAIYVSLWSAFAIFILFSEGVKGIDAIRKSREYMRGILGKVFVRMFFVSMLPAVITIPINALGSALKIEEYLAIPVALFSFIYAPFATVFYYKTYESVKAFKGEVVLPDNRGKWVLWAWSPVIVAGIVVVLILLLTKSILAK